MSTLALVLIAMDGADKFVADPDLYRPALALRHIDVDAVIA